MDVKKKQDSGLALSNAFSDQSMALSSSPQYVLLVRAYVRKWKNGKTHFFVVSRKIPNSDRNFEILRGI